MKTTQRLSSLIVAAAVALTSVGLAPPAQAGKYAHKNEVADKAVSPEPGKALVYILRTTRMGSAIYIWTFLDQDLIGVTRGRAYAVANVDPGSYVLWSKAENVSAAPLEVEAGKTYYVKQVLQPGFGKARSRVELLSDEEGREALDRIAKLSEVTQEGRDKASTIASKFFEKASERATKAEGKKRRKKRKDA